jgi:uncharacterized repeat protein (TIGR01451 family)
VRRFLVIRGLVALVGSLALALGATTTAEASFTIGQSQGATDSCGSNQVVVQEATAGAPSYVAQAAGVIVSWSYLAHASSPDIKLKVYHSVAGDPTTWFARSQSAQRTGGTGAGQLHANQLNTFTESPGLRVAAGDTLGLTASGSTGMACVETLSNSDTIRVKNPPDTTVGQNNGGFVGQLTKLKVGVSAVVEPDADGDGFGDETQDSCPTDATVHSGPCPAEVSIVKTAGANPMVGSDLTFTLAAKNNHGANPAAGVTVSDSLPAGVTFVSSSAAQGSCSGTADVTCSIGTLAAGQSTNVTIVVRPTASGPLSNTASVTTTSNDTDTSNNSSTVSTTVAPAPILLPVLSALNLAPPSFFAAKSGPSVVAAATTGTIVTYQNTQTSTITFTVLKAVPGVKKGKACVAPPKKKPKKKPKRCTRYVSRGTFTHQDSAGAVRFRFTGRLRGKTLAPGRYRLRAVARNVTGASKAVQADFKVKKPAK